MASIYFPRNNRCVLVISPAETTSILHSQKADPPSPSCGYLQVTPSPEHKAALNSRCVTIKNVWRTHVYALAVTEPLLQPLFEWDHLDFVPRLVNGTQIHHSKNAAHWFLQSPLSMLIFIPAVTVNALTLPWHWKTPVLMWGKKHILWKAKHKLSDISKASRHSHHFNLLVCKKSCPLSKGPGETVQQPDLEHHTGQSHSIRVDSASTACLACRKGKWYN